MWQACVATGPSSIAVDLTSDRKHMGAGVGRATGSAIEADRHSIRVSSRTGGPERGLVSYGGLVSCGGVDLYCLRLHALTSLPASQLTAQGRHLRQRSGFGVNSLPDRSPTVISTKPRGHRRATTSAQWRCASFSPSSLPSRDAQTLRSLRLTRAGSSVPRASSQATTASRWQAYWATTRNSLRALSERTGGFAVLEKQDLDADGLKRINAAMRK